MSALQYKNEDRSTTFNDADVWGADKLNRDDAERRLYRIVEGQERPLTICLNGEWGSGKTFFLTRFVRDYNKRNPAGHAVYFDAWQDDFLADPLLAIICQLKNVATEKTAKSLYKAVKNAAVPCLANVGLSIAKHAVKKCTGVDLDHLTVDDLETSEESIYEQYETMDSSRKLLREKLTAFAADTYAETKKPLLFVVDELDRCRPTFAIEVLERIKHLFCVPHLVFVIGADVRQLEKSIQAVYGDIDGRDYLHRFFDIEVTLPAADKLGFVYALWDELQLEEILTRRGVNAMSQRTMVEQFARLIKYRNLSLRQIEKCVRTYALLATSSLNSTCHWALLAAIAVVLKVTDEDAYNKFIRMEYGLGELIDVLYPDISYKDVDEESGVFSMVQHLSRIAYYQSDRTPAHQALNLVKTYLTTGGEIRFDSEIMPKCFETCSVAEMKNFYNYVFNPKRPMEAMEFRGVPAVLRQMDKGLQFIDR